MQTYAAIDLHSNNGVLAIIDETDRVLKQRRIPNKIEEFIKELEPFQSTLHGVAVESTSNWYWLVDGLRAKQFPVTLVNTAAIQQYKGLKRSDDDYDAPHQTLRARVWRGANASGLARWRSRHAASLIPA